ncbi:MAG: hypothetical protein AB1507_03445 [Bacillota bacterium]|jgi:hypothetical protein|nr:hypothetical protein [Thermoanaerobacteraceae bacterium]
MDFAALFVIALSAEAVWEAVKLVWEGRKTGVASVIDRLGGIGLGSSSATQPARTSSK